MKLFGIISLFLISCVPAMATYAPAHNTSHNSFYNSTNFIPMYTICTLYGLCLSRHDSPSLGNPSSHVVQKKEECRHHSLGRRLTKNNPKNTFNKKLDKRCFDRNSRHAGRNYYR